MKKFATLLAAATLVALTASSAMAANQVRVSQVFPGGGSGGATYTNDYIEIFNSGGTSVNIGGWALEYGSSTGNWGSTTLNQFVFPANTTIAPCSYILVSASSGTAGSALPVTADFSCTLTLATGGGKIGLFNQLNANLACGSEIAGSLVDKVAWGTSNCPENTVVGALSATTGAVRNSGGVTDTDNNVSDFTVTSNPVPHNSASAPNASCLATPTARGTWGQLKSIYR